MNLRQKLWDWRHKPFQTKQKVDSISLAYAKVILAIRRDCVSFTCLTIDDVLNSPMIKEKSVSK